METDIAEIAPDIFRLSTFISDANFMFNQFLVLDEEPLLFHTGPRALFPLITDAVSRLIPVEQLRWITFGHVEADECGSMNLWLAAAAHAEVAHGATGCMVSVVTSPTGHRGRCRTARCSRWVQAAAPP